jgi:hypothetical protein
MDRTLDVAQSSMTNLHHPIPIPILISRNIYQFFGLFRDDEQPDSDSDEDDAEDEDVRHHVLGVKERVDGRQLLTHQGST